MGLDKKNGFVLVPIHDDLYLNFFLASCLSLEKNDSDPHSPNCIPPTPFPPKFTSV